MSAKGPRIFISACEPSGDLHGEALAHQLRARLPHCQLDGIGGPRMRRVLRPSFAMEEFAVMGFASVLQALPRFCRGFFRIRRHLLQSKPQLIITIDYSGGHLRFMRYFQRAHPFAKWLHYIAPSTWIGGSRPRRILGKFADHLAVIFPNECAKWSHTLPCTFVGNPVAQAVQRFLASSQERAPRFDANPLIGLFPGSRTFEIARNLPSLLRVGERLADRTGGRIYISCAQPLDTENGDLAAQISALNPKGVPIVYSPDTFSLMRASKVALAVSGTACLELALLKIPTLIMYRLSRIDALIGRYFLRLPQKLAHFGLPNLLLGERNFPEFFGYMLDEEAIFQSALQLIAPGPSRARCLNAGERLVELFAEDTTCAHAGTIAEMLLT